MPTLQFDRITQIEFPGSQITPITSTGIVNNTLSLREILCSDRLAFGDINTNQFSCQLYNYQNLTGKKIVVKQVDRTVTPNVTTTIFTGWVDSCKMDDITGFVKVVAYDFFYKARKKKIKGWWNSYWSNRKQATMGDMWRSMLDYYSVSYTDRQLYMDNVVFKKNKQNKKLRVKSITSFLAQLCELNMAFPKMSREGVLEFIVPSRQALGDAVDIRGMYVLSESKFEDYTVQPYNKVQLYDSNNKLKATAGSGNNLLSIKNNLFLFGQKQEVFTEMAQYMLEHMHNYSYIPANITMKVAQLDVELGNLVRTDKGYSLVCENNYSGPLLVDQSMVSNDENEYDGGSIDSADKETSLGDSVEREDYRLQYEIDNKNSNYVDDLDLADLDDLGIEGDMYTKTGVNVLELHGLDKNSIHNYVGTYATAGGTYETDKAVYSKIKNLRWTNKGYQFSVTGRSQRHNLGNNHGGEAIIKITGIKSVGKHYFHAKLSYKLGGAECGSYQSALGFAFVDATTGDETLTKNGPTPGTGGVDPGESVRYNVGGCWSVPLGENQTFELNDWFNVGQNDVNKGYIWLWILRLRTLPNSYLNPDLSPAITTYSIAVNEFYMYHENETYTKDDIDSLFVNVEKKTEDSVPVRGLRSVGIDETEPEREWKEIKYLSDVDEGMHLEGKKIFLDDDILRMWFHANPPQIDRDYNQLCARFTGEPASDVTITKADIATDWSYDSCKKDKEGVYTIKNHGSYVSGSIQQIAYRVQCTSAGDDLYFNFRCKYTNASFGDNYTKSLGIVFSTSSSVNTTDYSGLPHSYDDVNDYASFYRLNSARYYDFHLTAPASTFYMIFVFGDITGGTDIGVTVDYMVVSHTEREYARSLYFYDLVEENWVRYRPFGSGGGDGESGISYLSELNDVEFADITDGQVVRYNSTTDRWENKDGYTLPIASASRLGGIKVGTNLSIDENGVLSSTGGGQSDLDAISLTQEEYDELTPAEKTDPDKLYFITDGQGGGGGGGGGGSTVIVNPLLTQGTPIAEITVDGITQTLYAPGGGGALTSTYTRIQQAEYSSADVDTSTDSYTLISDPNA